MKAVPTKNKNAKVIELKLKAAAAVAVAVAEVFKGQHPITISSKILFNTILHLLFQKNTKIMPTTGAVPAAAWEDTKVMTTHHFMMNLSNRCPPKCPPTPSAQCVNIGITLSRYQTISCTLMYGKERKIMLMVSGTLLTTAEPNLYAKVMSKKYIANTTKIYNIFVFFGGKIIIPS